MIPPVAVIADAHFHDPGCDYGGAGMVWQGQRRVWRPWADAAGGPRAVNEARAVLEAVLDDIAMRGIRHVVLLGDYVDDGQAEATARLAQLLQGRRGMAFYALPGNHDVFAAHGKHVAGRFATSPRAAQLVTSDPVLAGQEAGAVLTPAMRCAGQPAGLRPMEAFGYFRQPQYLHWESPFGASDRAEDRIYPARSPDGGTVHPLMDASYLVEPAAGLWLLMIDANAFVPNPGPYAIHQKRAFTDPSDAGWNVLPAAKPHLLPWIADVAARARAGGKRLLAFSHYPTLDPLRDGRGNERALFGETALARRTPRPEAGAALARAGVRVHASGHLHMAGITRAGGLTEIAVPSPVAFPGGYAILETGPDAVTARLMPLPPVPDDPALAAFYAASGADPVPDLRALLDAQMRGAPAVAGLEEGIVGAGGDTTLMRDWWCLRQGGPLCGDAVPPARLATLRRLAASAVEGDRARRFLDVLATSLARRDEGTAVTVPLA